MVKTRLFSKTNIIDEPIDEQINKAVEEAAAEGRAIKVIDVKLVAPSSTSMYALVIYEECIPES